MKNNFSAQSDKYARYRPTYPAELFEFLNHNVQQKNNAWDCGTGNGQVAFELAKTFRNVFATDISQSQLDHALKARNIFYSLQPAEKTVFSDKQFDLIVVAQAIHWFQFDPFYSEVRRTAKDGALLCVLGYGRVKISKEIDALITHFYQQVIGPYWDKERKYIDDNYQTIPFPFDEIPAPAMSLIQQWSLEHLIGYLNTWSAVKHFIKQNGYNPVDTLQNEIARQWGTEPTRQVEFPLLLRIGRVTR